MSDKRKAAPVGVDGAGDPRRLKAVARRLLTWYGEHARDLPWRRTRDPYAIWISEIMLQQTQVDTVRPYYQRWLQAFPDVRALAGAPLDDVLRLWEGLGYYSRARNLHRAAITVVERFGGSLPSIYEDLRSLPGIGPYTAAAIASIAFDLDVAVVDGNVKRVLARVFAYRHDVKSSRGLKDLQALADRLVPAGKAGDYNQAVMDLGATICTPRQPRCDNCPLNALCLARELGLQAQLPVSARRAAQPMRRALIAVVTCGDRVLVSRRTATLLGGLWAFPSIESDDPGDVRTVDDLAEHVGGLLGHAPGRPQALLGEIRHTYTHFKLSAQAVSFKVTSEQLNTDDVQWAHIRELGELAMGKVDRRVAEALGRPDEPSHQK